MPKKKDIYRACCEEIVTICDLFPGWSISEFIQAEGLDISNAPLLYSSLKDYRQQLELDNHVITDDEETEAIMAEGIRIHSILIKQQMYGNEE